MRLFCVLLAGFVFSGLVIAEEKAGISMEPKSDSKPEVVVKVNGEKITTEDTNELVGDQLKRFANMDPERLKSIKARYIQQAAEMLIMNKLVEKQLKEKDLKVGKEQVEKKISELAQRRNMSADEFKKKLEESGVDMKNVYNQIEMMLQMEVLIDAESEGDIDKVTDEQAKEYFEKNKKQFSTPEQVRASHVLIKTEGMDEDGKKQAREKIEEVQKKAKAGEDFAKLAKDYSEDPGSKDKGGEYTFGRGRMVPEFEKAAFDLEPGEVSDIVETQYGFHVIKLSEKIPADEKGFEEVKDQIKEMLKGQQMQEFARSYLEGLKEKADIEWAEDYKPQPQPNPAVIQPQKPEKASDK